VSRLGVVGWLAWSDVDMNSAEENNSTEGSAFGDSSLINGFDCSQCESMAAMSLRCVLPTGHVGDHSG